MENNLQYKLTNYEAQPPSHLWDEIEAALDHQLAPGAAVLHHFQQAPPAHIWYKIEEGLPIKEKKKVVPLYNRKPLFIKYAAAAAVLLFITAAISIWINKNEDKTSIAIQTPSTTKEQTVDTGTAANPDESYNVVQQSTRQKEERNAETMAKTIKPGGRYLTRADEEGKKVRLSKKVASVFNCADDIASVNNLRCKENIESLRQKISTSLISPSGDFSGLMDMIKTLEENE